MKERKKQLRLSLDQILTLNQWFIDSRAELEGKTISEITKITAAKFGLDLAPHHTSPHLKRLGYKLSGRGGDKTKSPSYISWVAMTKRVGRLEVIVCELLQTLKAADIKVAQHLIEELAKPLDTKAEPTVENPPA